MDGLHYDRTYPFVFPSPDIAGLIESFYVCTVREANGQPAQPPWPLFLSRIYGLDRLVHGTGGPPTGPWVPINAVDFTISSGAPSGAVQINTAGSSTGTDAFGITPLPDDTVLVFWTQARFHARLVARTAAWFTARGLSPPAVPAVLAPASARLDGRCLDSFGGRLEGIGPTLEQLEIVPAAFAPGWNCRLAAEGNRVQLDLEPGAGTGTAPGDPYAAERGVLRRLGGATANARGDLLLRPRHGLDVRPDAWLDVDDAAILTPNTLRIDSAVGPCHKCEDFDLLQRDLLYVWDRFARTAEELARVRQTHRENLERWRRAKVLLEASPVRVQLVAHHLVYVECLVSVVNQGLATRHDVELDIVPMLSAGTLAPGSSAADDLRPVDVFRQCPGEDLAEYELLELEDPPFGTGPRGYRAYFDELPPAQTGVVRFRLVLDDQPQLPLVTVLARSNLRNSAGGLYPVFGRTVSFQS